MDYDYCKQYDYLLTRKCHCGGEGEMLIDFVDDFVVRCSRCKLSTHAYMSPEEAAERWNRGDDIMEKPMNIFLDNPEIFLAGEIAAIHIADPEFYKISHQSCDFSEAVFEYTDNKKYCFEHEKNGNIGKISVGELSGFNREFYCHTVRPAHGETIRFEKIIYSENGDIKGIVFRQNDTWLFVFADEYDLTLTRSSFDLSDKDGYPQAPREPMLFID